MKWFDWLKGKAAEGVRWKMRRNFRRNPNPPPQLVKIAHT